MLLVGNGLSVAHNASVLASEDPFAAAFNAYYCDSRRVRACLDGTSDAELLTLTRQPNAPLNSSTENAALSISRSCQQSLLSSSNGGNETKLHAMYKFLDDCTTTSDNGAWCGRLVTRTSRLSAAEHRTEPAPFALNRAMFESFAREWPSRMLTTNLLFGNAICCMVLAAVSVRSATRWAGSGKSAYLLKVVQVMKEPSSPVPNSLAALKPPDTVPIE